MLKLGKIHPIEKLLNFTIQILILRTIATIIIST